MTAESRTPPSPENLPGEYTPTKVQERLEYARHLGQRNLNPNPRSEIYLQLYSEAATNALEDTDEEDRNSNCKPITQRKELEEKLLELKRLEYYVRYGEYLAEELSMFEETARMVKTDNHEELQQYWRPVNEKRREEREVFEEKRDDPIETLIDIWIVAKDVKLQAERVESGGDYPSSNEADIETLSAVIRCINEEFFTVDRSGDEDFPPAWRANMKGRLVWNQLRGKAEGKERIKAELVEKMVKRRQAILARKTEDMEKAVGSDRD